MCCPFLVIKIEIRKDGKNMKRKLAIMALAAAMVVSNIAPSTAMVAHAAESDEIGGMLDDIFGGDKPDNSQGEGTTGGGTDEIDWDNMNKPQNSNDGGSGSDDGGSSDSGNTDNSDSENSSSTDTGDSGSDNSGSSDNGGDEIGDILDDIFGGSKPDNSGGSGTTGGGTDNIDWDNMNKPQNGGSDNSGSGNTGNSGSDNSGNTGSNAGSSTTVTDPDTGKTTTTTANADGSTTVVTTDPATGETTSVIVSAGTTTAVDVTDPAILALLPEAMIVTTPEGLPFVHALDVSRTVYSVWSDGYQVDAFYITDAAGTPVAMQAVDIVTAPDGKSYVNVTIDPAVAGATVQAAEEQRVAFAKHYGIDGVMINGVLADTFVALAA